MGVSITTQDSFKGTTLDHATGLEAVKGQNKKHVPVKL